MPTYAPTGYLFFAAVDDGSNLTASGTFTHILPSFSALVSDDGDGNADTATDWFINSNIPYSSYTINIGGQEYGVFGPNTIGNYYVPYFDPDDLSSLNGGSVTQTITKSGENASIVNLCFVAGTLIATPEGPRSVEDLHIGDRITTSDGRTVPVKWLGRQTHTALAVNLRLPERLQPVRIRAGALGDGLPHGDLVVTADHGMIVDGLVINASALVNGTTIDWVPLAELPDQVTYYHVETEDHDVILANGALAETFIDYAGRQAFDNYAEYVDLYGAERIIPEMDRPRISSARLVPASIKARLGVVEQELDWDGALSA